MAFRALSLLATATSVRAAYTTGPESASAFMFGDSGDYLENFDAAKGLIYGAGTSGDIFSVDVTTGTKTLVYPYTSGMDTNTGFDITTSKTPTAVARAVRVNRDDKCELLVSYNEGESVTSTGGNPIGVKGGLAIIDICASTGPELTSYIDLTEFGQIAGGGENQTVVADAIYIPSTGKYVVCLLIASQIVVIDGNTMVPSLYEPVSEALRTNNCNPNGLELSPDGTYVLISCFLFAYDTSLPEPTSGLLRWDFVTQGDPVTPVVFDVDGPLQVDDIRFTESGDALWLSVGDLPGTPFANSAVKVTSNDAFLNANIIQTNPQGCSPMAAITFINDTMYSICFGGENIMQFGNFPPAEPPSPFPPPSPPPPSPPPAPSTPPAPPPGAPSCLSQCTQYRNGADPLSKSYPYMCMKEEGNHMICAPLFQSACDGGMLPCRQPHTEATTSTTCFDTAGSWANRKCAKKADKGKCSKKRVAANCQFSCGTC